MRTPLLVGEFELAIDEKSRMLIPSEIRKKIDPERDGDAFYMVLGVNRQPWMYCEKFYEELVASQRPPELSPRADQLEYDQLLFAMASRMEMDKQGRVLIPQKMRRRTGLEDQVTLVGVRDHMELWNRSAWDNQFNGLYERQSEVVDRAKQARQNATPSSEG